MNTVAHLDTTALDTAAKFFRIMQKAGADFTGPLQNVAQRDNLTAYLQMGCPKINSNGGIVTPALPEGKDFARNIRCDDYLLTPEDVAKAYGWSYTKDQLVNFTNTLPDMETVLWLRSNGYMLVATPPTDFNLLQVRDLDSQLFCSKSEEAWYTESKHTFSCKDVVKAGQWLMVRKEPYPNSRCKMRDDQQELLTEVEHVPNAPEVSYAVTAYFKVRDIYLLQDASVRTSSVDAGGHSVFVGDFGPHGLHINHNYGTYRNDNLGVASARK